MRTLVAVVLGFAAALPAQRVSLQHEAGRPSAVERLVADLAVPAQRAAAMARLWSLGAPAVPVLTSAVARGDEGAAPALQVLAHLGGAARSAVPQLQRLLQADAPRCRRELEFALAAIGERDSVLVADFTNGLVIEFDADGSELRRVHHDQVWSVQPLPGDRLLVACDGNFVEEIDWRGNRLWSAAVPLGALDARRLIDGTTVVACWHGPCVVALGQDGKELWRIENVRAVDVEPLPNGNFLVAGYEDKQLLEADARGKVVWRQTVPDQPMDVDALPDGNLLVTFDRARRLAVIDRAGNELRGLAVASAPEDAQRLPDGRMLVAWGDGAALLDADGVERWRYQGGQCGHVVARIATATVPSATAPPGR